MNVESKKLAKDIILPLVIGGVAAFLTRDAMSIFESVNQPPLSPPGWLFPVVWTFLYIAMGVSIYWVKKEEDLRRDLSWAQPLYYSQLVLNFLWPIIFFGLEWYLFAASWLVLLWLVVFAMIKEFWKISPKAAILNLPYLIWLTFALYLNIGVWWLNR